MSLAFGAAAPSTRSRRLRSSRGPRRFPLRLLTVLVGQRASSAGLIGAGAVPPRIAGAFRELTAHLLVSLGRVAAGLAAGSAPALVAALSRLGGDWVDATVHRPPPRKRGLRATARRGFDPLPDAVAHGQDLLPRVRALMAERGAAARAAESAHIGSSRHALAAAEQDGP